MSNFNYKVVADSCTKKKVVTFFVCRNNLEKVEKILNTLICPYTIGGDYYEPIVQIEVDNRSEYLYIRYQLENELKLV